MKKILLGMAALAVFASSCGDKNSETVTPDPPPVAQQFLTGVINFHIDNNGAVSPYVDSFVINYNADKTFNTREEIRENGYLLYKLVYDQQKVTKLLLQYGKNEEPATEFECLYSGDKLVRYFRPGKANISYDSLVWENNKVLKVINVSEGNNVTTWEYTWQNDNVTEIKEFYKKATADKPELSGIVKYTYSNVPNARKAMGAYLLIRGSQPSVEELSANESDVISHTSPAGVEYARYTLTRTLNENKMTATDTTRYTNVAAGVTQITNICRYKYTNLSK